MRAHELGETDIQNFYDYWMAPSSKFLNMLKHGRSCRVHTVVFCGLFDVLFDIYRSFVEPTNEDVNFDRQKWKQSSIVVGESLIHI